LIIESPSLQQHYSFWLLVSAAVWQGELALRQGDVMEFTKERLIDSVLQRDFQIEVNAETVPCVLWAPEDAQKPRPLLLMGHGGSQHKKTQGIRQRAIYYAMQAGWATLAIDAPGHGDRISREAAEQMAREVGARVTGQSSGGFDKARLKAMARRTEQAVPEWQAALETVQQLDYIGAEGPVGYWGVSMGTAIGVPFVAAESRIKCAVFGLAGLRPGAVAMAEAAAAIDIPIEFVFQWEDAVAPREHGIELFNTFGSQQKTMHINPGGHMDIPSWEAGSWFNFYQRHLHNP